MYKYNKIMIGLDHTETDVDLIKAASDISELSGAKEIYFVNIIRDFQLPEKLQKEFPNLLDNAINDRKRDLKKAVDDHFKYSEGKVIISIFVEHGQVTRSLLKFSAQHKIDLIILGRKNEHKAGGVLVSRIARRAACSLLIIPKGSVFRTGNILVPTDFSDYSISALEKAATFARKSNEPSKLTIQNVYQVPVGYHYTGKSFKDFSEIMKEHAKNDYLKFISKVNLKDVVFEETYTLDKDDDIITDISKMGKKIKADLIAIGAKGLTSASALFIGSKAERLIQLDAEIPLLVVRPKGKRAGLMEFIREM